MGFGSRRTIIEASFSPNPLVQFKNCGCGKKGGKVFLNFVVNKFYETRMISFDPNLYLSK